MITKDNNQIPKVLKDYLNYHANLNKSKNTIHEYQYDLTNFLKYIKWLNDGDKSVNISDVSIYTIDAKFLNRIDISDIYEYLSYLKDAFNDKPATRARKVASIRSFFKYLHMKAKIIDDNPAKELESPKLRKTSS